MFLCYSTFPRTKINLGCFPAVKCLGQKCAIVNLRHQLTNLEMKYLTLLKGKSDDVQMVSNNTCLHDGETHPLDLTIATGSSNCSFNGAPHTMTEAEPMDYDGQKADDDECSDIEGVFNCSEKNENDLGLAGMNFNTNGVVAQANVDLEGDGSNFLGDSMTKIKQINIGEIPLEPMGLSISSSGMQLFVKLDPEIKKALVSNAEAKRDIKTRKNRRTTTKTKIKKGDESTLFVQTTQSQAINVDNNEQRSTEDDRQEVGIAQETPTFKYPLKYSRDGFMNMICPRSPEKEFETGKTNHDYEQKVINLREDASQTKARQAITKQLCRDVPSAHTIAKCPGISETNWSRELKYPKITASDETKCVGCRRNESVGEHNQPSTSQALLSRNFKSSDLPLTKPKGLMLSRRYDSPEGHNRHNKRRHKLCIHPRTYPSHRQSSTYSHSSNEDDDLMDDHEYNDSDNERAMRLNPRKKERLNELDHGKRRHSNGNRHEEEDSSCPPGRTPEMKLSEQSNNDSSIGPSFDISQFSPQMMDSETLTKFTEYTQDMRKDLKQRYKDLSKLLRDFNQNVKEKNGNDNTERDESSNRRDFDKKCVVM